MQYFIHKLENHNSPLVYKVEHMRMKYSIRFQSIEKICIGLDYSLFFQLSRILSVDLDLIWKNF
jgi:hypothetical protein